MFYSGQLGMRSRGKKQLHKSFKIFLKGTLHWGLLCQNSQYF